MHLLLIGCRREGETCRQSLKEPQCVTPPARRPRKSRCRPAQVAAFQLDPKSSFRSTDPVAQAPDESRSSGPQSNATAAATSTPTSTATSSTAAPPARADTTVTETGAADTNAKAGVNAASGGNSQGGAETLGGGGVDTGSSGVGGLGGASAGGTGVGGTAEGMSRGRCECGPEAQTLRCGACGDSDGGGGTIPTARLLPLHLRCSELSRAKAFQKSAAAPGPVFKQLPALTQDLAGSFVRLDHEQVNSPSWLCAYLQVEAQPRPTPTQDAAQLPCSSLDAWHRSCDAYASALGKLLDHLPLGTPDPHLLSALLAQRNPPSADDVDDAERDVASLLAGMVTCQFHAVLGRTLDPRPWLSYNDVALRAFQLLCYSLLAAAHRGFEFRFGLRPPTAPGRDLALRIVAASASGDRSARALLCDATAREAIHTLLTRGQSVLTPPCREQLTEVRKYLFEEFGSGEHEQEPLVTVRDVLMFGPSGPHWRPRYRDAANEQQAGVVSADREVAAPVVGVHSPECGGFGLAALSAKGWSDGGRAPFAQVGSLASFHGKIQILGTPSANKLPPHGAQGNRFTHMLSPGDQYSQAERQKAADIRRRGERRDAASRDGSDEDEQDEGEGDAASRDGGGEDEQDEGDEGEHRDDEGERSADESDSTSLGDEEPVSCFVAPGFPGPEPAARCECDDPNCPQSRAKLKRKGKKKKKKQARRGSVSDDSDDPNSIEHVSTEFDMDEDDEAVKAYAERVLWRGAKDVASRRVQALRWARFHLSVILNAAQHSRGDSDYCAANYVNMADEGSESCLVNSRLVHAVVALPKTVCTHVPDYDDGLIPQVYLQVTSPNLLCDGSVAVLANYDHALRGVDARARFVQQPKSRRVQAVRSAFALLQSMSQIDDGRFGSSS